MKLRKVEFLQTGKKMYEVAKVLPNKELCSRLNTLPQDAVANDVAYHLKCWVIAQREIQKELPNETEIQEMEDVNHVIGDIDNYPTSARTSENDSMRSWGLMRNLIGRYMHRGREKAVANTPHFTIIFTVFYFIQRNASISKITDMNTINETYNNLLRNTTTVNYKRYLKSLLQSNISDLIFSRPLYRRKSETVYTDSCKNKLVDYYSNKADNFVAILDVARKDIMEERQWKFCGSFSGFEVPKSLSTLLEWILVGPKTSYSDNSIKKTAIDNCINNIAQIVMIATKSRK